MKTTLVYTAVTALLATTASAGNLVTEGVEDPTVLAPPVYATGWAGPYAGLSFSRTEARVQGSDTYRDEYEEAVTDVCHFDGGHSGGKKCTFPDGVAQTLFPDAPHCNRRYSQTCFMSDNRVFIKGASGSSYEYNTGEARTVYGPHVTEYFTDLVEHGDVGGFAGYRFDLTPSIVGGLEVNAAEDVLTGEIQAGYAMGELLPYIAVGTGQYDGNSGSFYGVGADFRVSQSMFVGGKYTVGEFDGVETETLAVRVGARW